MEFKDIFNFLSILLANIKRLLGRREVIADFKEIEKRIRICRSCEYKSADALKYMKCEICKCRIRYKARLISSACPIGKWASGDS